MTTESGRSFVANEKATLAGGGSRVYQLHTPKYGACVQLSATIHATADVTVVFSEGSDRSDGTALTTYNRDRASSATARSILSHSPTGGSTNGTALISFTTPDTGEVWPLLPNDAELKLKRNTKYTVSITDVAGGCTVSTTFYWTEDTRFTAVDGYTTTSTSSTSTTTTTTAPP